MKNHFDISGSIEIREVDIAGVDCILAKEISVAKLTKILKGIISLPTISVHHIYGTHSPSEFICRIVSMSINEKC